MIDTGLMLSAVAVATLMWLHLRFVEHRPRTREVLETLLTSALWGVVAGRAVAVLLDDPASFASVRTFLVVRGGVEFWPGAAVASAAFAASTRRSRTPLVERIASGIPASLVGYAAYEATCWLREGCYGPPSSIGLRPEGLETTMVPVAWLVAVFVVGVATALARRDSDPPYRRVLLAVAAVAAARAVAGFWLPRLGDGLTRQHVTSGAVATTALAALVATILWRRVSGRSVAFSDGELAVGVTELRPQRRKVHR